MLGWQFVHRAGSRIDDQPANERAKYYVPCDIPAIEGRRQRRSARPAVYRCHNLVLLTFEKATTGLQRDSRRTCSLVNGIACAIDDFQVSPAGLAIKRNRVLRFTDNGSATQKRDRNDIIASAINSLLIWFSCSDLIVDASQLEQIRWRRCRMADIPPHQHVAHFYTAIIAWMRKAQDVI